MRPLRLVSFPSFPSFLHVPPSPSALTHCSDSYSINEAFDGSPLAVSVPKVLQKAKLTEVRQRKNSRSQSANLPGETRDEIRRHMELQNMPRLPAAVEEDEEEDDDKAIASGRA